LVPEAVAPGDALKLQLFIEDRALNLLANGIFVRDGRTNRLVTVKDATEKGTGFFIATIPIEANCPPGQFPYEATVIDESGNLKRWSGTYTVGSR
jgi:hypothetical protein